MKRNFSFLAQWKIDARETDRRDRVVSTAEYTNVFRYLVSTSTSLDLTFLITEAIRLSLSIYSYLKIKQL